MTNHCWYTVKIDMEKAFNPSFVLPFTNQKPLRMWGYKPSDIFNPEWIEYTKLLGINFKGIILFYRKNYIEAKKAHIDIYPPSVITHFGFNWVGGGKGSKMIWYETPKEKTDIKYTDVNTPYLDWPVTELTPIEEYEIKDKLTLVKTGIPHEIYNVTNDRWCISARTDWLSNTSWEEIVDYLDKRNLLEPRNI